MDGRKIRPSMAFVPVTKWVVLPTRDGSTKVVERGVIKIAGDVFALSPDRRTARRVSEGSIFDTQPEALKASNGGGETKWILVGRLHDSEGLRLLQAKVVCEYHRNRTERVAYVLDENGSGEAFRYYFKEFSRKKEALQYIGQRIDDWKMRMSRSINFTRDRLDEQQRRFDKLNELYLLCKKARVRIVKSDE